MYRLLVMPEGLIGNLFDPSNAIEDWRVGGTGILNFVVGSKCTGFIPVVGGETYTISWSNDVGEAPFHSFFTTNAMDSEPIVFQTNGPLQSPEIITAPDNARFLVVNLKHGPTSIERENVQVEQGDTVTAYKPFGESNITLVQMGNEIFPPEPQALISFDFEPFNVFDNSIRLDIQLFEVDSEESLSSLELSLKFYDGGTDDVLYTFKGTLEDISQNSSLLAVMDASEEFSALDLNVSDEIAAFKELSIFNELNSLGRNKEVVAVPEGIEPNNVDIFNIITQLDDVPTTLYMQFNDDVSVFTELVRVASKLDVRLFVEFDPTLTTDQVISLANDLAPSNHRVRFLWSVLAARPINAVGIRGKKVPRVVGGVVVAGHMLREANVNTQGIPPLHQPIAGYDYPIAFTGTEQRLGVVLDDPTRKKLANAQVNVAQRIKYDSGVRYIIGDVLVANNNPNSLLKTTSASDISMFIDNRLKQICFRHLPKAMEDSIEGATKDAKRFLDSCTTKERKLLTNSDELGGFYSLEITPFESRHDAIAIKCGYHPHGATRAIYLDTFVSK